MLPQLRSEPTVLPSPPPTPDHYWRARDAAVRERQTRVRALRAAAAPAGEGEGSEAAAPGEQQEEEEQQPAALEGGITAVAASVLAPSGDEVPAEAATEAAAAAGADVLGDPLTGSLPSPPDARADAQPAAERAFAPTPQRAASVAGAGSPGAPSVRPVAGEAVAAAGAAEHGGAFRRQGQHEASPWAHPAGTDSGDDGERPPVPSLPSGLSLPHGGYGSDDHAAEARLLPPRGSSMVFASSLDVEGVSVIAYSLGSGPASPGRSAAGEHSALSTSLAGAGAGAGAGGDVAAQWLFKPVAGTAERRAAGADPPHPTAAADVAVPGAGEALPAAQGGGSSAPNTPQRRRRTSRAGAREAASGAEAGGRTVSGGPCSLPAQSLHAAAAAAVPQQSVTRWGPSTPQPAAVAAAISCDGGDAVPRPVGSSASDGSGDGGYVGQGGQEVAPVPRFLAQPIRPWAASLSNGLSLREINLTGCSVTNRLLLRIGALCPNLVRACSTAHRARPLTPSLPPSAPHPPRLLHRGHQPRPGRGSARLPASGRPGPAGVRHTGARGSHAAGRLRLPPPRQPILVHGTAWPRHRGRCRGVAGAGGAAPATQPPCRPSAPSPLLSRTGAVRGQCARRGGRRRAAHCAAPQQPAGALTATAVAAADCPVLL